MDTRAALLWATVGVVLLAAVAAVLLLRRRHRRVGLVDERRAYLRGVQHLLSDDPDAAIAELTQVVKVNTEAIETYFALGALFRRKGEVERAIRIHQNLLLRPGLAPADRDRARFELALDYRKAGLLSQAREALVALVESDGLARKERARALELLRDVEVESGHLDDAVEAQRRRMKVIDQDERPVLAHLYAEAARRRLETGDAEGARKQAKEALHHHAESVDAHLALAEALLRLRDFKGARRAFDAALTRMPEAVLLCWQPLCDLFYSEGRFEEMAAWLRDKIRTFPQVPHLRLALARHLRSRGLTDAALEELQTALELEPRFHPARREFGRIVLEEDMSSELRTQFGALLDAIGDGGIFACSKCGHRMGTLRWRCPRCGRWDTVASGLGEDASTRKTGAPPAAPEVDPVYLEG